MEIGEHDGKLGRWRTVQQAADPRLRTFAHGYFASSSMLRETVRERHVPSIEVPLLLNFGAPHRRLDAGGSKDWSTRDGIWVVGLHDQPQLTEAAGERHFMVVRFTPIGAHLFLGLPMHLLVNGAIELASIDPGLARLVMNRVGAAGSWADRFAAMEALIAERVVDAAIPIAIESSWRRLVAANGRVTLGSLAADMDCSHRTLIARFRTYVGLPPKTIARLLRFNRAMRALDRLSSEPSKEPVSKPYIESDDTERRHLEPVKWADMAADCGYFDQAHLIKEFRQFAGSTPTTFLRKVAART